ncbi:hypothetical protein EYF80_005100 [Liparis tanakae]|uniref:Uncharacterized protein n=1 Tax=Liparis tanakae TaxID=230148 RepID=A0A4Z2J2W2_9TELE|nr:hypothetical protein EYF80_005100 [Liparis tanakae]
MRKSKRNQLTGGEGTPVENAPQRARPPCCWGPHAAAVEGIAGTGDEWAEEIAGPVIGAGTGVAVGIAVGPTTNTDLPLTHLPWTRPRVGPQTGKAPHASTELTWLRSPGSAISWKTRTMEGTTSQAAASPHHEQALVEVQVRVPEAPPMLHRLGGPRPLLLLSLTAPGQSWAPETAVQGHTDSVEAPWQLVSGGPEAAHTHLHRLRARALGHLLPSQPSTSLSLGFGNGLGLGGPGARGITTATAEQQGKKKPMAK